MYSGRHGNDLKPMWFAVYNTEYRMLRLGVKVLQIHLEKEVKNGLLVVIFFHKLHEPIAINHELVKL